MTAPTHSIPRDLLKTIRLAVGVAIVGLTSCRIATEPSHSEWNQIVAGGSYTCGLSPSGEAFCWGGIGGYFDQPIMDSVAPNSAVPLRVPGGRRFTDIVVGTASVCATDAQRTAYCWGANLSGELGDASLIAKLSPSPVAGGFQWRVVAMDEGAHACGITTTGLTGCWGNGFRGALGNGLVGGWFATPVAVVGEPGFAKVYAGVGNSCGLTFEGAAHCWGANDYGILGDGETPQGSKRSAIPIPVVGGHRFASLAMGGGHSCGITLDGRAYCWGTNDVGQLGDGTTAATSSPTPVATALSWTAISVGSTHTCGLAASGAAYCWGGNDRGQLANGSAINASTPHRVPTDDALKAVTAGDRHTCALTASGKAICWGRGDYGQLGNGSMSDRMLPTQVISGR